MTRYLLNSLPNSLLVAGLGEGDSRSIKVISERKACRMLGEDFTSAIGHQSTAKVLSERMRVPVEVNRIRVEPQHRDLVIAALVITPRRLAEDEVYTEEEILALPITWVMIEFDLSIEEPSDLTKEICPECGKVGTLHRQASGEVWCGVMADHHVKWNKLSGKWESRPLGNIPPCDGDPYHFDPYEVKRS